MTKKQSIDFEKTKSEGYGTTFQDVEIEKLHIAKWNYKLETTEQQREKFRNSIKFDKSIGVLCVRETDELPDGEYEVIDGNHRLEEIKALGWKIVHVENFGRIPLSVALTVARRRNHEWFPADNTAWSERFRDEVLPDFNSDLEMLEKFMPDTLEELEAQRDLLDFDWDQYGAGDAQSDENPQSQSDMEKLTFEVKSDYAPIVNRAIEYVAGQLDLTDGNALVAIALGRVNLMMKI